MLVDKETVLQLMSKDDSNYEANYLRVNTLPEDTIFEISVSGLGVVASYIDNSGTICTVSLDYQYMAMKYVSESVYDDDRVFVGFDEPEKDKSIFSTLTVITIMSFIVLVIVSVCLICEFY